MEASRGAATLEASGESIGLSRETQPRLAVPHHFSRGLLETISDPVPHCFLQEYDSIWVKRQGCAKNVILKEIMAQTKEELEARLGCECIPPLFCKRVNKVFIWNKLAKYSFWKSAEELENAGVIFWHFLQKSEGSRPTARAGSSAFVKILKSKS